MLERFAEFATALPELQHEGAVGHLLRADRQEDVCFALWNPSYGRRRVSGLICELVFPTPGERTVRGNVSFNAGYFERAIGAARSKGAGLALMHSHIGPGWQAMSGDDYRAEAGHAGSALGATGLPLLGMTIGTDGAWSARFWQRKERHKDESCGVGGENTTREKTYRVSG